MRLYKIQVKAGDEQNPARIQWEGTQGAAATTKRDLAAEHGLATRTADITIEQVDVPTQKEALLDFLNGAANEAYAEACRCGGGGE